VAVEALIFRDFDRAPRKPIDSDVTIRDGEGYPVQLALVDLSETGFLMESDVALSVGESFSIGIPGVAMHGATVRRVDGNRYGCEFLYPLTAEELAIAGRETVIAWPGTDRANGIAADEDLSEAGATFYERYSRPVRIAIYIGGLVLSWAAVFAIARLF